VFHYGEYTVRQVKDYLASGVSRYGSEIDLKGGNGMIERKPVQYGWMDLTKTPIFLPATMTSARRPSMNAGSADSSAL